MLKKWPVSMVTCQRRLMRCGRSQFDRFAAGIGDAVATSIFEAEDFGEAMENIGKSESSRNFRVGQIAVKKLALAAMEKSTIISTNSTALISGSATAAGLASAYAPAGEARSLALKEQMHLLQ